MSEQDEAGSADTLPPLLPPPPPQPAASRANAAATPSNAASESLLLTLPPRSPSGLRAPRVVARRGPQVSALAPGHFKREAALQSLSGPKWRNWQTRRTQNPVPFGECGFDSHLRHSGALAAYDRAREGRRA